MSPLPTVERYCKLILAAIAFGIPLILTSEESNGNSQDDFADLEAFLDETDLFLEDTEDPLFELDQFASSPYFWSTSFRIGSGHSSNFLKRSQAVSSPYLTAESDFFLNGIFAHSTFTTLLYFEATQYEENAEADWEAVAFLHANWTEIRARHSFGANLDAFYGHQIYDASLLKTSINPTSASLEQFRPEVSLFLEWDVSRIDSLKATVSGRRSRVLDEEEDFWRPGIALEWTRFWTGTFKSRTEVSLYQEFHDDQVVKTSKGLDRRPEEELHIKGIAIEEVLTWKPARWESFSTSMRFRATREVDPDDDYDGRISFSASVAAAFDLKLAKVNFSGSWHRTHYENRQVSFTDDRLANQRYRTLQIELERTLGWNLSFKAGIEWNEFKSRVSEDNFSERRIQALLDWTY